MSGRRDFFFFFLKVPRATAVAQRKLSMQ